MSLQPKEWNVIIIGRWNPAIFTPAGISKRVFKLGVDPPSVQIAVPLDGVEPYQVRHPDENIIAMANDRRLMIQLINMDYATLEKAMTAATNALEWLPVTPLSAAGFNVRFRTTDHSDKLINIVQDTYIDDSLTELGCKITDRMIGRTLDFNSGKLNFAITGKQDSFEVLFNFHLSSGDNKELIAWLETPIDNVQTEVEKILKKLDLEVEEMEVSDDV